jgi:hypothetical protein
MKKNRLGDFFRSSSDSVYYSFSLYPKKEVPALFNQKTRWDYGTHREEFRAVFNRPDGKKYKGDWIKLLTTMLTRYAPLISSVQARYFSLPKDESYSACLLGYYQAMVRYVDETLSKVSYGE